MPAPSNGQLVNGADLRAYVIGAGDGGPYQTWLTSDPGTGVLPNNKVLDGIALATYTSYSTFTGSHQCPTYLDLHAAP